MKIWLLVGSLLVVGNLTAQEITSDTTRHELKPIIYLNDNYQDIFQAKFDFTTKPFSFGSQNSIAFFHPMMIGHMHGMFCTMEYKMETKMKMAPKFRLGSVNYANWMEGKGEYYMRYWK